MRNDLLQPLDFPPELCHTNSMNKTQTFFVAQTQPDGTNEVLWQCTSYQQAQNEVDRINNNLQAYGIPSSVSCAYVID